MLKKLALIPVAYIAFFPFTFPATIMAAEHDWTGTFVALGAMAAFCSLPFIVIFCMDRSNRRPGETWRAFFHRNWEESEHQSHISDQFDEYWLTHTYVLLDCGHGHYTFNDPADPYAVGREFWCNAHRRNGPAQLQHIVKTGELWDFTDEECQAIKV